MAALMNNPEVQKIMNDPKMMNKAMEALSTVIQAALDPAKV